MSDLETVRDALRELRHPSVDLVAALIQADQEIVKLEDTRDSWQRSSDQANNRADLFHRRCELAVAILRDDEAGLTYNQLNQLADVIWPKAIDVTQKPTDPITFSHDGINLPHEIVRSTITAGVRDSEPAFYITPTWGEKRGWELTNIAQGLLASLMDIARKGGITLGPWYDQYVEWSTQSARFRAKFSIQD